MHSRPRTTIATIASVEGISVGGAAIVSGVSSTAAIASDDAHHRAESRPLSLLRSTIGPAA